MSGALEIVTNNPFASSVISALVIAAVVWILTYFNVVNILPSLVWARVDSGYYISDSDKNYVSMQYATYSLNNRTYKNLSEVSLFLSGKPTGLSMSPECEYEVREGHQGSCVMIVRGLSSRSFLSLTFMSASLGSLGNSRVPDIKSVRVDNLKVSSGNVEGIKLRAFPDEMFRVWKIMFMWVAAVNLIIDMYGRIFLNKLN